MDVNENDSIHQELVRVGQMLAARRRERKLKIADISATLFILPEYLEAIEAADLGRLPEPAYIIGYIRTYANFLGLPAAELCRDMHQAMSSSEKQPQFNFVENKVQSPIGSGRLALVSVVVGAMIYGGWFGFDTSTVTDGQTVAESAQSIEDQIPEAIVNSTITQPAAIQSETAAGSEDAGGSDVEEVAVTASVAPATPAVTPAVTPAETIGETVAEAPTEPAVITAVTETAAVDPQPQAGRAPSQPSISAFNAMARDRDPETEMIITAIGTSWVELNRADGSKIAAWLMRSGEVYTVATDDDIYLTTGNAGGLSIALGDGTSVIPGKWGEALREMPLDPTLISDRNQ